MDTILPMRKSVNIILPSMVLLFHWVIRLYFARISQTEFRGCLVGDEVV